MPSKKLSTIVGGGAKFPSDTKLTFERISSGISGIIKTLTPVAGRRVVLNSLAVTGAQPVETNIRITVGGIEIITNTLANSSGTLGNNDSYRIGNGQANDAECWTVARVVGGIDETIVISKTSGTTAEAIDITSSEEKIT